MNDTTTITRELLASVLQEQRDDFKRKDRGVKRELLTKIEPYIDTPHAIVISGLRRVGKSTFLAQIADAWLDNYYVVSFEDERLLHFSSDHFDMLHETLITLFGECTTFLFDEIQNVPEWERFVRRMIDKGYKFIITGSNASLLSQELGTRLTGRHVTVELFPFSFGEYMTYNNKPVPTHTPYTTHERAALASLVEQYLIKGGIPDTLKYPQLPIHKTLYDDVLYRDIAARYGVESLTSLKELSYYLMSNSATYISYNKLKELLKVGSVNTITSYIEYLHNSWLIFTVNKYAWSIKTQQIAAKKIYTIDTGLMNNVGFSFSPNKGRLMENIVFLHLRKQTSEIFYYKTQRDYEVDFYLPHHNELWQVALHLNDEHTKEREIRALVEAYEELPSHPTMYCVTMHTHKTYTHNDGKIIHIIPLYDMLRNIV